VDVDLEFDDPKRVTVGYLGVPGDRTFLLEVEDDVHRAQFQLEKAQVAGLGDLVAQLLARLDDRPPADWDRDAMSLEPPFRPIWRVGGIAVGLDTDSVRLLIELTEFVPEGDTEPRSARISMDRDQARRFAAHAVSIVGEGRARCRLCSRPIEVDGGHVCPGTNGHGPLTS
jgi:uncharacterized repeat protein (TIGR03847 family)